MSVRLFMLLFLLPIAGFGQEICDNGRDDDGDGLIDLQDEDCRCTIYPLIKNPSFEKLSRCPSASEWGKLQYATGWIYPQWQQDGITSTDLYHKCGQCFYNFTGTTNNTSLLAKFPMPVPDGSGFIGFLDDRRLQGFSPNRGLYKEYAGSYLDGRLDKDSLYELQFWLGFISDFPVPGCDISFHSLTSFSPYRVSLFGNTSSSSLPYGRLHDTAYKSCPLAVNEGWIELATVTLSSPGAGWVNGAVSFRAPAEIRSIVIGPSCETNHRASDCLGAYYLLDNVLLFKKETDSLPLITQQGSVCTDTVTLGAGLSPALQGGALQWYRNGVALPGETAPQLKLTKNTYGAGDYRLRVAFGGKTFLSAEAIVESGEVSFTLEDSLSLCIDSSHLLKPVINTENNCSLSYLWSDSSTQSSLLAKKPGIYWLEVDKNGCKKRDTVLIKRAASPYVSLGADTVLCGNNTLLLQAGSSGTDYRWQDGSRNADYRVTRSGNYWVKVSNGICASADTIRIQYKNIPLVRFANDTILCEDEIKILQPQAPPGNYLWNTGSTLANINVSTPGVYWLQVQNECGSSSDTIRLTRSGCELRMPSAFTPNSDGRNDVFGPAYHHFMRNFEMKIFNRWGQLVYNTSNPAQGWDGNYKNKPLSTGIFVWTTRYTDYKGREQLARGTVSLIR